MVSGVERGSVERGQLARRGLGDVEDVARACLQCVGCCLWGSGGLGWVRQRRGRMHLGLRQLLGGHNTGGGVSEEVCVCVCV